jgi:hypothetical protein
MDGWSRLLLVLASVLALLALGAFSGGHVTAQSARLGWAIVVTSLLFEAALARPLLQLASEGCDRIWPVCVLSCSALVLFLVAFYWSYFCFVGNLR